MRSGSFAIGLLALVAAACSSSSSPVAPAACDGGACGEDGAAPLPPDDSGSANPPPDGGVPLASESGAPGTADAGADAGPSLTPAFLGATDVCLDAPLPAGPGGETSCVILLIGVPSGCAQPGLSPATPQQVTLLLRTIGNVADDAAVLGNACQLAQLAPSASAGTDCASAASGWCYLPRACAANPAPCTQAICTTAAFDTVAAYGNQQHPGYGTAFFDCP